MVHGGFSETRRSELRVSQARVSTRRHNRLLKEEISAAKGMLYEFIQFVFLNDKTKPSICIIKTVNRLCSKKKKKNRVSKTLR